MSMSVKSTFKTRSFRRNLLSAFLLFVLFFSSLFSCILIVNAADSDGAIHVSTAAELVTAVNNVGFGSHAVIALDKDISLTSPLSIPTYKDITLVSASAGMSKLIGAYGQSTIYVTGGLLRLDSIIVTHENSGDSFSYGVNIFSGTLILSGGEISGNQAYGVYNSGGNFTMIGGKIFNNRDIGVYNGNSFTMSGGEIFGHNDNGVDNDRFGDFSLSGGKIFNNKNYGVSNIWGIFIMYGGEIFDNGASYGGGVSNTGVFEMWGGKIFNNTPLYSGGGGVSNSDGGFIMWGGEISGNSASRGGGICITGGNFTLSNGVISDNSAGVGGGIYMDVFVGCTAFMSGGEIYNNDAGTGGGIYLTNRYSTFIMIDGKISSNTATNDFGGGIYTAGNFDMKHGEISNNKAVYGGGGIYNVGIFRAFNGVISNNKAGSNGGGIGVPDVTYLESIYIYDGVVFSNNSALIAYNRDSIHDGLYNSHIDSSVIWTAPFTQGYNNYDISYIGSSPITSPEPTDSPYSPYPSIQPSSPSSSNTEKGYIILGGMALIIGVAIILAIISIIAIVVVFLFSKK